MKCKYCNSENVIRYGKPTLRSGKRKQKYFCKKCNQYFTNLDSYKRFRKSKRFISEMIDHYSMGFSFYKVGYYHGISPSTVYRYVMRFAEKIRSAVSKWIQNARFSTTRHMDITELLMRKCKVFNKVTRKYEMIQHKAYIYSMIDNVGRFVPCFEIYGNKDKQSTDDFFNKCRRHQRPKYILTDGSHDFTRPIEKNFNEGSENFKKPKVEHVPIPKSDPRYKEVKGMNNLIERNFMTTKTRTKVTFRYRKIGSLRNIMYMFYVNYNFIKPHRMIKSTPADKVGPWLGRKRLSIYHLFSYFGIQ